MVKNGLKVYFFDQFILHGIHINLQSNLPIGEEQLGSPLVSTVSAKPNVYGPRPPLCQFLNLVFCSPKQSISIKLTLSGQRIGYCLFFSITDIRIHLFYAMYQEQQRNDMT